MDILRLSYRVTKGTLLPGKLNFIIGKTRVVIPIPELL